MYRIATIGTTEVSGVSTLRGSSVVLYYGQQLHVHSIHVHYITKVNFSAIPFLPLRNSFLQYMAVIQFS